MRGVGAIICGLLALAIFGEAAAQNLVLRIRIPGLEGFGRPSAPAEAESLPDAMAAGDIFFQAYNDAAGGMQLYTSDGTPGGSGLFLDLSGEGASEPGYEVITTLPTGEVIFSPYHPTYGRELWKVDPDGSNAELVADINPGVDGSRIEFIGWLSSTEFLISAENGTDGQEPFRTDGLTHATQVGDLNPGSGGSIWMPARFREMGGNFYFIAEHGVHGAQLWRYDGTDAVVVTNFNQVHSGLGPDYGVYNGVTDLERLNAGSLLFAANEDGVGWTIKSHDGTTITDVCKPFPADPDHEGLFGAGDMFQIADGIIVFIQHSAAGVLKLFSTDGTVCNELQTLTLNGFASNFTELSPGWAIFPANADGAGHALWKTDGTSVMRVSDVNVGDSFPGQIRRLGDNSILFSNADSNGVQGVYWTDGAGTVELRQQFPVMLWMAYAQPTPHGFLYAGDAGTGVGAEFWIINETGSTMVLDVNPDGDGYQEW